MVKAGHHTAKQLSMEMGLPGTAIPALS